MVSVSKPSNGPKGQAVAGAASDEEECGVLMVPACHRGTTSMAAVCVPRPASVRQPSTPAAPPVVPVDMSWAH
ncbi:hypothetical protein ATCC27039_02430 [Actinomyces naeslundii]|nr:hypothetical protein ATCC27039_02430 [Actinomyces naeslundii]